MQKAYIILAHKNPIQLLRLITRLDDYKSTFYLHIDKRVDICQFNSVVNYGKNVNLINRESTHWAGMGLVNATLNGLRAIKESKLVFDRIILLSGQDYPIKKNDFINSFLKNTNSEIFIDYTTLPDIIRWKDSGGLYRINKYYFGLKTFQKYAAKVLNLGSLLFPPLQRKYIRKFNYYAGSQWWIINSYAVDYILNYVNKNPKYTRFHKYTFAPDEVYFHTILLNSTDSYIKSNISNRNIMFMKWIHSSSSHPELLDEKDVSDIIASNHLFARKFEQETNSKIFDLIDSVCC